MLITYARASPARGSTLDRRSTLDIGAPHTQLQAELGSVPDRGPSAAAHKRIPLREAVAREYRVQAPLLSGRRESILQRIQALELGVPSQSARSERFFVLRGRCLRKRT